MSETNKRARFSKSAEKSTEPWIDKDCSAMLKALALPEILQEIFHHLDTQSKGRAAQVSWTWHDVIHRRQQWSDLTVGFLYDESDPSIYKIAPLDYLDEMDDLDNNFNSIAIQPYCREFPFITELAILSSPTDTIISMVVRRFRNLVSLKLWKCARNNWVTDTSLILIVSQLKSLQHLGLNGCTSITNVGVATLCGWNGVGCDVDRPMLQSLSLSRNKNVTNEALKFLSVGQPALQSLDLSRCDSILDSGLEFLIRLVNLRELNLEHCEEIYDEGMIHLAQMVNLTNLNISSIIFDSGLELLASGVSQLTNLTLAYCEDLDDACGPVLARMTHLVHLNLSCTRIGDTVLRCLADGVGATAINSLNLMECANLTSEAGRHLARMVNLQDLNLARSPVSDTLLSHLADAADSKLEILSFIKNEHLTHVALTHVARLPRLHCLNVCNCDFFTKWFSAIPMIVNLILIGRCC